MSAGLLVGVSAPDASAIAQIDSTTQGLLAPRMTTTERNAIVAPATGLTVYNTTTNTIDYYTGSAWAQLGTGSSPSFASITLTGTGGLGFLDMPAQSAPPSSPASGHYRLSADSSGYFGWVEHVGSDTFERTFTGILSASRAYSLPNSDGLVAILNVTSTATAGATTTLDNTATGTQIFTGTLAQTVKLPDATTLQLGQSYLIRNSSSGVVTVQDAAAGAVVTLAASQEVTAIVTNIGSAAGAWSIQSVTGSGQRVNATSPTLTTPTIAILGPASDSTTAVKITKADKSTAVVTIDTTNLRLGINTTPTFPLHVSGDDGSGSMAQFNTAFAGVAQYRILNSQASANTNYAGVEFRLLTSTTERAAASLRARWQTTTDASRVPEFNIYMGLAAGLTQVFVFQGSNFGIGQTTPANALDALATDAATNTVTDVARFSHTGGTGAAGFGTGIVLAGKDSTTANTQMAHLQASYTVITHASRTTLVTLSASDAAAERLAIGWGANGSAALLGFYPTVAAAPVIQYATTGTTTGFTAGAGTAVDSAATFTGNTGSTAYTISDIVRALKLVGLMAA